MVERAEMFRAKDGKIFATEKDAAEHEMNSDFTDRLLAIVGSFAIPDMDGGLEKRVRTKMGNFVINKQHDLLKLLLDYRRAKKAYIETYIQAEKGEGKDGAGSDDV